MDVRNLQKMMKQMNTEELDAEKVEIFLSGGKSLRIDKPSVVRMQIMGQVTYQVSGNAIEIEAPDQNEDAKMVSDETGASVEEAEEALKENSGDIAAAILKLKKS